MVTCKLEILNVTADAKDHKYWVINLVDGRLWFYGAYDEDGLEFAQKAIDEVDFRFMIEV